jgi:hypothetical protein
VDKSSKNIWAISVIFQKSKQSPNGRKFTQSGHPASATKCLHYLLRPMSIILTALGSKKVFDLLAQLFGCVLA